MDEGESSPSRVTDGGGVVERAGPGRWRALGAAAAIVGLAAALRLSLPGVVEYKADERFTMERTQRFARSEQLPMLGMATSGGPLNPGMSVWVFAGLGWLSGARNPAELARAVQMTNVAAFVALVCFVFARIEPGEREAWLWAAALAAANPFSVLFQRKIWPPSVLPLLTVAFLAAWRDRDRRLPAFLWGLLGVTLGQIHFSGFPFAAGFALWTALAHRSGTRWGWAAFGAGLSSLPMLPWLAHLVDPATARFPDAIRPLRFLEAKFYVRWLTEPFGLGLDYSLGTDFPSFLAGPAGTGLVGLLHLALLSLAVLSGLRIFLSWRHHGFRLFDLAAASRSFSASAVQAAFWGCGLLLTASGLRVHRHYGVVLFVLPALWLVRALGLRPETPKSHRGARLLVGTLVAFLLALSVLFLRFLDLHGGAPGGDFGVSWAASTRR